jgi:hypothetical protein
MRMTPAQIAMNELLGENLGPFPQRELGDLIRHGHEFLVKVAGVDLGYDPEACRAIASKSGLFFRSFLKFGYGKGTNSSTPISVNF